MNNKTSARYLSPDIAVESLIRKLKSKGIHSEAVLKAFRNVPRHLFLDSGMYEQAYDDNALPIGLGQTISQPSVVALMTQLLELTKDDKILEIGTGSGFQTAILAQFSPRVYSIERHRELGDAARLRLREMGFANIVFKIGDGTKGWAQHAPFNKIIVTAGAPAVPKDFFKQIAIGGRMIIPTGDRIQQRLEVYVRHENHIEKYTIADVAFVPLIGSSGWESQKK
jgi:protein-L-isoaspartate(D-aspartate) O-methyltransferase